MRVEKRVPGIPLLLLPHHRFELWTVLDRVFHCLIDALRKLAILRRRHGWRRWVPGAEDGLHERREGGLRRVRRRRGRLVISVWRRRVHRWCITHGVLRGTDRRPGGRVRAGRWAITSHARSEMLLSSRELQI